MRLSDHEEQDIIYSLKSATHPTIYNLLNGIGMIWARFYGSSLRWTSL